MEAHGIGAQDEHFIPTPNGWTNREGELSDPTIPKELCGDGSTRLGGPFGIGRVLYNNSEHSATRATRFQMVTGKSPIVPTTWVGQPPSDASEEVPMVTQLDEERRRLWEMAKANLEKAHKRYKDFADKSRREVNFEEGDEVWLNIKNFRLPEGLSHKFLGPYAGPFKVLEKKFPDTYKLELPENRFASRPRIEARFEAKL